MQIRLVELVAISYYFLSIFKDLLLRLKIRLVENYIMGLKQKPFEQDARKIQNDEQYKSACLEYEKEIRYFRNRLVELKLIDAKLAICPHAKTSRSGVKAFDPIESLVESMKDADFDFFPSSIKHFFQKILGLSSPIIKKEISKKKKLETSSQKGRTQ